MAWVRSLLLQAKVWARAQWDLDNTRENDPSATMMDRNLPAVGLANRISEYNSQLKICAKVVIFPAPYNIPHPASDAWPPRCPKCGKQCSVMVGDPAICGFCWIDELEETGARKSPGRGSIGRKNSRPESH